MAEGKQGESQGLSEGLGLDEMEQLDDSEFDLPEVVAPPSLESILNEPDDDSFNLDEQNLDIFQDASGETSSLVSLESLASDKPLAPKKKAHVQYASHGSILRHVVLKGVSAQVMSAADRVDAGMPTAMAVSHLVAIGSSHGLILVFDPKQVLKWCLGSTAVGAQYGAVSALSINHDCTRLLSGFAKGQITMWDLTTGKLLRTITDAHPPGTAVLHIKFTDDPTLAVCCDSGGSVFELSFKRLMGMRTCESRCLFSGARGEVTAIEPLLATESVQDHPMKEVSLLAMASLSKMLIVSLKPHLKVLFAHPLKGEPTTLPVLAWQFVMIQITDTTRIVDPVLAFGRGNKLFFFQVSYQEDEIKFSALQKMELQYVIIAVTWVNSRTLVLVDAYEKVHVLDVRTEEELEVIDISDVQLVYASSFFKSLATGGNVSKALALAGERACYNSVVSFSNQLLFLGTKSIHVMTIRTWMERIDLLVKQNKYIEALSMAESFYLGRARAVVGLHGGLDRRTQIIADKMLDLLLTYVDVSMTTQCPASGKIEVLVQHYQTVVPVCVDYCLLLGKRNPTLMKDILFGGIYDRFCQDPIARGVFLECLEPYILNDNLRSVTPQVMKDFMEHYQHKGLLQNIEACIVHMDVANLDVHQVVVMCWLHGLYDALIYIYNKGMQDYITPLEELLRVLQSAIKSNKQLTDDQTSLAARQKDRLFKLKLPKSKKQLIKLGNKLLVYISCCLAGRAYPLGDIPPNLVDTVKSEVFKCVTVLHTKDGTEGEQTYPYLRTLVQFDTREFLNVLALAFEEPEFNTEEGMRQRQRIVDILLQVMVESVGFTPTQVGCLFTFLARQMARHENSILVNRLLFEQVLEFLASPEDDSRHEERQQALLELLNAGGLQQVDEEKLLSLAENARFYRVCELLYEKRRDFDKILACYLRDAARRQQVFSFIHTVMTAYGYSNEERNAVHREAMTQLEDLVSINSKKTAQLVITDFAHSLTEIVSKLDPQPVVLYDFLQGLFDTKEQVMMKDPVSTEPSVTEKYIDLMCRYNPQGVMAFLKNNDTYRLEETLQICRKHKSLEATAYLLEKAGDVQGAFNIMLETLVSKVKVLNQLMLSDSANTPTQDSQTQVAVSSVQTNLLVIIQILQRNSGKMQEEEREGLWFPLMEVMLSPQRKHRDSLSQEQIQAYKDLTRHVLNSMMGYIALPSILQKIMQDPAYNTGKFGEIRELLLGMLDTYNYEQTLLKTTNSLLSHDLHWSLCNLKAAVNKGLVPRQEDCGVCGQHFSITEEQDSVIVFSCGHAYHTSCLQSVGCCHMIEGTPHWSCSLCNVARREAKTGRGRTLSWSSATAASKQVEPLPSGAVSQPRSHGDALLSPQQELSYSQLQKSFKGPSRLAILAELKRAAKYEDSGKPQDQKKIFSSSSSILQNENFQLKVAAPPVIE
ncbi:vacuolar protein sorting-associated protein 8 homolog isoform X1 [Branchiostoma floridae x Branchiostoma japonicum]